jgi:hypothetical protein
MSDPTIAIEMAKANVTILTHSQCVMRIPNARIDRVALFGFVQITTPTLS